MKTFLQLQDEVLRYFDVTDEPDGTADRELVKEALNAANQARVAEDKWKFMLSSVKTLSVVAGTQEYILPHTDFQSLQYLYSTTNRRWAQQVPMSEVPFNDVGFGQNIVAAESRYFDFAGFSPVKVQPTSASTITVASSEAADDTEEVYIEGEDSSGESINETVSMDDGVTTQSFAKITYVAKAHEFAGTLTLTSTVGSVTLLTLTATEVGKQYPIIKWTNIPAAADTFQYRYWKRPRVMSRDFDTPDLPFPISNILVYDALLDLATYNELDSESVNIWRDKQQEWKTTLYMQKFEGDSLAAFNMRINEMGEAGG